jgi:hypothetical protein
MNFLVAVAAFPLSLILAKLNVNTKMTFVNYVQLSFTLTTDNNSDDVREMSLPLKDLKYHAS